MRNNWKESLLKNAPLEIIDGDRGINYPKLTDFCSSGYCLFLNTGNVTVNGFNFSECDFINSKKDNTLRKGKLNRYDVVLTTRGTVGNVAFYGDDIKYENIRINSGMVILRANPIELLPYFLYLYVRSNNFKQQVASLFTGSAQPQLPIRDINRINIPIPPLSEQHVIVEILGSLDDKIELNHRMNATLEEMAQALFKHWFVDNPEVKEWSFGSILQFAELLSGGTPRTTVPAYWNGDIEWISAKDVGNASGLFLLKTEKRLQKLVLKIAVQNYYQLRQQSLQHVELWASTVFLVVP